MNKFIVATSFNVQNRNKDEIAKLLTDAYGKEQNVVLIDINNINSETLDKYIKLGGIDCFVFSSEYMKSEENKNTIKSIITTEKMQKRNTKMINIYDSNDEISKETSIKVGDMLVDELSSSLVHFDINAEKELFLQSLRGIKNDTLKSKEQLQIREEEIVDFLQQWVEKIEADKGEYTSKHIRSVTQIADAMAIKMGLSDEERDALKIGAMLHDVGKIDVSSDVLNKPSRLTDEEFEEMKSHVLFGEIELDQFNLGKFELSKVIASQHHEKFDGTGYPRGLKGEEINKLSRILSIADSAQAMFGRNYQQGKTKDDIISELNRCAGTQFDPEMVDSLIDILEKEPKSIGVSYSENGKINYQVETPEKLLSELNNDKTNNEKDDYDIR